MQKKKKKKIEKKEKKKRKNKDKKVDSQLGGTVNNDKTFITLNNNGFCL